MSFAVYRNGTVIRVHKDPVKALHHVARAEQVYPENIYKAVNHSSEWKRKMNKNLKKNRP